MLLPLFILGRAFTAEAGDLVVPHLERNAQHAISVAQVLVHQVGMHRFERAYIFRRSKACTIWSCLN